MFQPRAEEAEEFPFSGEVLLLEPCAEPLDEISSSPVWD